MTGASSGIGKATALELARRGASVVLAARRLEELEGVALECRFFGVKAVAIRCDVTSRADCDGLMHQAGIVDVLVNNAGFATFDEVATADLSDFRSMLETNFLGVVNSTQAVLPQMLRRGDGTIINVASIAGLMGFARMSAYCASKHAVVGFTEALRDELKGRGVRVALVCPGTTETEFFVKAERSKMPGASRLLPAVTAERVARAVCDSAEDGRYRRILPLMARMFMRFKEISPVAAHALFRAASSMLERR